MRFIRGRPKLRVTTTNPANTSDYCGNMIYNGGNLKKILVEGGYITFYQGTPEYQYYLQDHQGNNRVAVYVPGYVQEVNHYYPFGLLFGESYEPDTQEYKYNGKEFDEIHGLNLYDYNARFYDPALCRFTTIDPMCEKYYHLSPYAYCGNSPVNLVDPSGMDWVQRVYDSIMEFYYDRDITSQKDIDKKYGKNSGIKYVANNYQFVIDGESFIFKNDLHNNKDGYVLNNKGILDNSHIYYGDSYTIFGTTDNSVNAETLHKNYFGTSYTGPNNPKNYIGFDSYQYFPRNKSEYGSYIHDLIYEINNAKGIDGAIFNTAPEVINADLFLAQYNYMNMINPQTPLLDRVRSALTAPLFSLISGFKYLKNKMK